MRSSISRRSFLKSSVALGAAGAAGAALLPRHARLIDAALASNQATSGSLSDIEHIVILMQENRSFDHYFGTMSDVRGFSDPAVPMQDIAGARTSVFDQMGPKGYSVGGEPFLSPFELVDNFPSETGQTTNDITHDWGPQHFAWNSGAMDQWLIEHLASDGSENGFLTMGYFTRSDLPFYYALADAFTICDGYHCSVLGPTYPNRLMQMAGSLGADGQGGVPVLETYADPVQYYGSIDWLTFPEVLTEAGVSWKVYQDPSTTVLYNVLPFFKNYSSPSTSRDIEVAANGLTPQYPAEFVADVAAGTLPSVSWILPPAACCEHPAAPPEYGEWLVSEILSTLVSNPDVWAKTIFLLVYDENGGWFDHVPPPTPGPLALSASAIPTGDQYVGEYVTAPLPSSGHYSGGGENLSIYGPLGLGFRTPCIVMSPYSRGGFVCSETFDHTSMLKLISARFGVPVPNASAWRLATVGDMTGALALTVPANTGVPSLPATSLAEPEVAAQAVVNAFAGTEDVAPIPYPAPTKNSEMPAQESAPVRIRLPLVAVTLPPASAAGAAAAPALASEGSSSPRAGTTQGPHGYGYEYGEDLEEAAGAAGPAVSGPAPGTAAASSSPGRARRSGRSRSGKSKAPKRLAASKARSGGGDDAGLIAGIGGGAVALGLAAIAGARRWLPGMARAEVHSDTTVGDGQTS